MQVKKFEAPTMQEALNVVKRELGPAAIILHTKQNKKGFGLLSKGSVEITAAIAEKELKKKIASEKNLPEEVKQKIWNKSAKEQSDIYENYFERQMRLFGEKVEISKAGRKKENKYVQFRKNNEVDELENRFQKLLDNSPSAINNVMPSRDYNEQKYLPESSNSPRVSVTNKRYADISDSDEVEKIEVKPDLKKYDHGININDSDKIIEDHQQYKTVEDWQREIANSFDNNQENESIEQDHLQTKFQIDTYLYSRDDTIREIECDLVASGIARKYVRPILKGLDLSKLDDNMDIYADLQEQLAEYFVTNVRTEDPLQNIGAKNGKSDATFLALIGPTGVGKTTTIAKIASQALLDCKMRVGLINFDSYRVGAVDQLSTYAKIMNAPFRSANTTEELQEAIFDFESLDLVLIDTTGRSHKDQESLMDLSKKLKSLEGIKTSLVLSACTRDSDQVEIINKFSALKPEGVIVTKLDETGTYGSLYNISMQTNLPLNYFTIGQRVPEDIEKATGERVADLILKL